MGEENNPTDPFYLPLSEMDDDTRRLAEQAGDLFELDLPEGEHAPVAPLTGSDFGERPGNPEQLLAMDAFYDNQYLRFPSEIDEISLPEAFVSAEGFLRGFTGRHAVVLQVNDPTERQRLEEMLSDVTPSPLVRHHLAQDISKDLDRLDTPGKLTFSEHRADGTSIYVGMYMMAPGGHPIASVAVTGREPFTPDEQVGLRDFLALNDSHLGWIVSAKMQNDEIQARGEEIERQAEYIRTLEARIAGIPEVTVPATALNGETVAPRPEQRYHPEVETPKKITILNHMPKPRLDARTGRTATIIEHATDDNYLRRVSEMAASKFKGGKNQLSWFSFVMPNDAQSIYTLLTSIIRQSRSFDEILVAANRPMYELLEGDAEDGFPNRADIRALYAAARKSGRQPENSVAKTLLWHSFTHYLPQCLSLGFEQIRPRDGVDVDFNRITQAITEHPLFQGEFPENHIAHIVAKAMNDHFGGTVQYAHHLRAFPGYFFTRARAEQTNGDNLQDELVGVAGATGDLNEMKTQFGMMEAEDTLGSRFTPTLPDQGIRGIMDWTAMYRGVPRRIMFLRSTFMQRLDHAEDLSRSAHEFSLAGREKYTVYLRRAHG